MCAVRNLRASLDSEMNMEAQGNIDERNKHLTQEDCVRVIDATVTSSL